MIGVCASELERRHAERAIAAYVHGVGPDLVPEGLLNPTFAVIASHSTPLDATSLDVDELGGHRSFMTFTEVARRLDMSPRNVSRLVAAGRLSKVGRRILTADVAALEAQRSTTKGAVA